jgi:hypothetical protein
VRRLEGRYSSQEGSKGLYRYLAHDIWSCDMPAGTVSTPPQLAGFYGEDLRIYFHQIREDPVQKNQGKTIEKNLPE